MYVVFGDKTVVMSQMTKQLESTVNNSIHQFTFNIFNAAIRVSL